MRSKTIELQTLTFKPLPRLLPELEHISLPRQRIHSKRAQIQIALVKIGQQLKFRTWVAQNDKGIVYQNKRLGEMDGVIARLNEEKMLTAFPDAVRAARLIDCVWFKNSKLMPAVIEIEHSTGVLSGLTRMLGFQEAIPGYPTRWIIAAPDEDRKEVIEKCNRPQFASLNAQFFPYSAIEELYSLSQRRKIRGVTDEFLDCFIEPCRPASGN